jgi:hypothetical protein
VMAAHAQLQSSLAELESFLSSEGAQFEASLPPKYTPVHDAFVDLPQRIGRAHAGKDTLSVIEALSRLTGHFSGGRQLQWAPE